MNMAWRVRSIRIGLSGLIGFWLAASPLTLRSAASLDYSLPDPDLRVIRLDSAPTESFLAVKVDTAGRLFVGGRDGLCVYEPKPHGGYEPRRQLLKFPDHTWVYDIEIRGDDLYLLTVSALYVVPEGRLRRENLHVRRLVWGVPMGHVHQCFHGMTWGPEGDLYFAMGDPLTYYGDFNRADHWGYWTFFSPPASALAASAGGNPPAEWVRTPYNGVGGVFRCRPDGSGFQVVATGLRNCCGLAFDRDWNLFTNDNDHESIPADYVPGRLNHVTPHAYFSWPRGWMPSKTPDRLDLLETMNTSLGRFVPVGQSYYDDTYLPETYRNSLLVARWCTRQITFYPLKHHGATFQCDERELLAGKDLARPVHVTVGRGGRIFATICYMAHNEGSPVYKSDLVMITRAGDGDDHPFDAYEAPTATKERLFAELSSPDWSRRKAAHTEILRRGGSLPAEAAEQIAAAFSSRSASPAKNHLVWLAATQLTPEREAGFRKFSSAADPAVRLNAIRALDEYGAGSAAREILGEATGDQNPQVRLAALGAFFRPDRALPAAGILAGFQLSKGQGPARNISDLGDSYLRQTIALLLAERASIDTLGNHLQSGSSDERLLAVLAAGFRLTMPRVTSPLSDDRPLAPWRNLEEASKIHFIDGLVDVRDFGRSGLYTIAGHWKAVGHSQEEETLFALLAARLADENEKVRLQAAYFLSLLNDERTEPVIARVRSDIHKTRLATAPITAVRAAWAVGAFPDGKEGFGTRHAPESGPFDSTAKFPLAGGKPLFWKQIQPAGNRFFDFREDFAALPGTSSYTLIRLESGSRQSIELLLGTDGGFKVWLNGSFVARNDTVRGALPFNDVVTLELQPGSNDLLIRVRGDADACRMYLHYRNLRPVAAVLPEPLAGGTLADRLKEAAAHPDQSKIDPRFLEVRWDEAAKTGDAARGKKLFSADGLGCAKCHAISNEGAAAGGPSLADAARRFTVAHLVESVLLPNKTISPVFKATVIATRQGKVFTGLIVSDTAERVELILTDTNRVTIPAADIEARRLQDLSPMPAGLVKSPEELRDLLAFLLAG
jgi:putative heme-binding domain-containing protein